MTAGTRGRAEVSPQSWDTFGAGRPFQSLWVSLGVLFLLPGLVATCLRVVPPTDDGPALLAAFIPYAVLAYLFAFFFFATALLRARRRGALFVLSGISALLLCCHGLWLAPLFISDQRAATTKSFTIMSLNMLNGSADPRQVADQAVRADVVVLLETTPAALQGLKPYGWDERFPYSVGERDVTLSDSAIYSKFPLAHSATLPGSTFQQWLSTADVPGIGQVRIIATHPCNPYCGSNRWAAEHKQLRAAAAATMNMPLIVVGDFNAVDDHGPIRALRRDGLDSATDIVGAGWLPTYPANRMLPPLLPIDHVLVNSYLTATSISTFNVSGTDHRGLMAQIAGTG